MWNYQKFFRESKIQEDISNIERELKEQSKINFESIFKNRNTILEDAIKFAIQRAFLKNNLNFEYDQRVHEFLRKERKDIPSIADFLNNVEASKVRTIMRAFKQEKIEKVVEKITEIYHNSFENYGVTKEEFSHLLQSTKNIEKIQPIVEKVGLEKIERLQKTIQGTYIRDLTNVKSGTWTTLLFGKIDSELQEKIIKGNGLEAILEEFQMGEGEVKQEVLMASEFSPILYPLTPENYWPPVKENYVGIIKEKVLETFDINNPTPVIQGIMSAKLGTVAISDEANRIRALYKKFNSDDEKFLNYISDVFISNGNPQETVKVFIEQIKNSINKPEEKDRERRKDVLFPEMESYFDSIKEKEIVDLVRDEFNLTCVASSMEFPITNDFTMNKKNFITDFVIYCDGFDGFKEREENGIKFSVPVIKQRLLLIGEYYGYYSDLKSKPLKQDLINPDGTPFLKSDGTPAVTGDVLTVGEEYKFKTQYKIITNDFCGQAIGCKTISIFQANSRKEQRTEVARGLDENKVIYNSNSKEVDIKSEALIELMNWYKNFETPEIAKNAAKAELSRYFDTDTMEKKPGSAYPLAHNNEKNKYLGFIYETIHLIKSKDLSAAILQSKGGYSSSAIQSKADAQAYLASIAPARAKAASENAWRIEKLKELYKEIQSIPTENGKLIKAIDNLAFLSYIKDIKSLNTKDQAMPNIYRKAYNHLRSIKRGIII